MTELERKAHKLLVQWRDVWVTPEVDRDKMLAETREWIMKYEADYETSESNTEPRGLVSEGGLDEAPLAGE